MSDFKAKMYQIVCGLGLRSRPCWGAYSAPRPSSWIFRGLLLRKVRGGEERGGKGKGGDPMLSRYTPSHYILDRGLVAKSL